MASNSDFPSVLCYREKISWKVKKEDWAGEDYLLLPLKRPLSSIFTGLSKDNLGGVVRIDKDSIGFITNWHEDVNIHRLYTHAEYKLKTTDGKCSIDIKGQTEREIEGCGRFFNFVFNRFVSINTELLYDDEDSFIFEADLLVEIKLNEAESSNSTKSNSFGEEIKSIFNDDKNSDVLVITGDQEFKCHKAILCARSEVFKNTLAHITVESNTNTIVLKETTVKAVEDMLKFIYSGDVPDDPKILTTDLLNLANMYQLKPLVDACLKKLVDSLEVSSCISTLMLVDSSLREVIIMFIQCKAMEVVEEEDWDQLMDSFPDLAKELVKAIARATKEKHKCQFCVLTCHTQSEAICWEWLDNRWQ